MPPMLDRFMGELRRAGHFTGFWAKRIERAGGLVGHGSGQHTAASDHRQVAEAPIAEYKPASTQGQQATTSKQQEQDVAHVGAWAKETAT
jgi:hypothetical protein